MASRHRGEIELPASAPAPIATKGAQSEPQVVRLSHRSPTNPRQWVYKFSKGGVVRAVVTGCGKGVFTVESPEGYGVVSDPSKGPEGAYFFTREDAMLKAYAIAEGSK